MAVIVFTTTGCAGYRLGSMLPPDIQTVHVAMFANHTSEPQLEGTTTSAVIAEFQRDATLRVVNKGSDADTRLDVELIRFSVQPLRYDRNRPRAADEYRITIRAKLVFRRVSTGVALVEKEVEGDSTFVVTGDLTSAKRAATPAAARDLAHDIVESVVESW
jgi:hypothetical protein